MDFKDSEKVVWCHLFMSSLVGRATADANADAIVDSAARIADLATIALRNEGAIQDAASLATETGVYSPGRSTVSVWHDKG